MIYLANITVHAQQIYKKENFLWVEGRYTTTGADTLVIWFNFPQDPRNDIRYKLILGAAYNGSTGGITCSASIYTPDETYNVEIWRESVAATTTGQFDFDGQIYFYPLQKVRVVVPLAEAAKTGFATLMVEKEVLSTW